MQAFSSFSHQVGKFFSKSKSKSDTYGFRYEDSPTFEANGGMMAVQHYPSCHEDAVMSVAAAGTGICVSGSKDRTVVVFDYPSGKPLQQWAGHKKEVTKVAYGMKVKGYFSASRDKSVCMWQADHPQPRKSFLGHDLVVTGLTLNYENTMLCTGSRDNCLKIWDIETGNCTQEKRISRNLVTHAKWGEKCNLIAQTSEDKETKIWDARNMELVILFARKQNIQTCCDINADNNYCLTASNGFQRSGCEATLWDIRMRALVCEYKGHQETVAACCFLPRTVIPGCNLIATCGNDCTVQVWSLDTAVCLAKYTLAGSGPLTSLAAFEDGSLCVSSFNNGIYVLQIRGGSCNVSIELIIQY